MISHINFAGVLFLTIISNFYACRYCVCNTSCNVRHNVAMGSQITQSRIVAVNNIDEPEYKRLNRQKKIDQIDWYEQNYYIKRMQPSASPTPIRFAIRTSIYCTIHDSLVTCVFCACVNMCFLCILFYIICILINGLISQVWGYSEHSKRDNYKENAGRRIYNNLLIDKSHAWRKLLNLCRKHGGSDSRRVEIFGSKFCRYFCTALILL